MSYRTRPASSSTPRQRPSLLCVALRKPSDAPAALPTVRRCQLDAAARGSSVALGAEHRPTSARTGPTSAARPLPPSLERLASPRRPQCSKCAPPPPPPPAAPAPLPAAGDSRDDSHGLSTSAPTYPPPSDSGRVSVPPTPTPSDDPASSVSEPILVCAPAMTAADKLFTGPFARLYDPHFSRRREQRLHQRYSDRAVVDEYRDRPRAAAAEFFRLPAGRRPGVPAAM
jgi:hypothetical protein